jgi:hypothetical protein
VITAGAWTKTGVAVILELTSEVKGKTLTLKAPIDSTDLTIDSAGAVLTMTIGLDRVKSGSFLLDLGVGAFLSSYGAKALLFVGSGPAGVDPLLVGGVATSGRVAVDLELELRPLEFTEAEMVLEVRGTAVFEDVEVPIPGIGRISDLTLQVWGLITMTPVA